MWHSTLGLSGGAKDRAFRRRFGYNPFGGAAAAPSAVLIISRSGRMKGTRRSVPGTKCSDPKCRGQRTSFICVQQMARKPTEKAWSCE